MHQKITRILLFLLFLCSYFIFASPVDTFADKYQLTSTDEQIKVIFNSRFGGAITELYDNVNFVSGNVNENLIDYYEGGALLQTCFWNPVQHALQLPCFNSNDHYYINPTQGGWDIKPI